MKWIRAINVLTCSVTIVVASVRADDVVDAEFFQKKIAPLLEAHCLECHAHATSVMENGLTLDSPTGWAQGGDNGPAIIPGEPNARQRPSSCHASVGAMFDTSLVPGREV